MRTNKSSNKLNFSSLPGFASYILENHIDTYIRLIVRYSIEEEIPLLKLFSHLSEEELVALSVKPHSDFLKVLIDNRASEYLETSIKAYKENKMEEIGQEDILIEDLSLGALVRRKVFREMLLLYTTEPQLLLQIMEELERYFAAAEEASYKALIEIQMERVNKMNDELTQTKEDLLELQELADMGSFVWNLVDGSSVFTQGVMQILGITEHAERSEFIGNVHPEDREKMEKELEAALAGDGVFESEYRYLVDGKEKNVWSRGIVTFKDGIPVSMKGTLADTTTKNKLLRELQESESLSKQAQALTHIGNWSWEVATGIVTWSDEMYRIYGLEPQSEPITFERFISLIHPDDRERRLNEISESLETHETKDYLLRAVNPDGTVKVLRGKGEVVTLEGKPVRLVGTCQDITKEFNLNEELRTKSSELEKVNASLATKNTELERINKELESFNYVASHDLQEPLRKIQLFTNRILEIGKEKLPPETRDFFDKIITSSSRMRLLIDDLLKFSRTTVTDLVLETADLNQLMNEVVASVSQELEEKSVRVAIGELPVVHGIPFQLHQLFLNLVSNSMKYKGEKPDPTITIISRKVSGEELTVSHEGYDFYHEVTVEDNGIGFDQENARKIFELFQRLHPRDNYQGTGIGLAICKKIAHNHKGAISAKGKPGEGSEFSVYFPVID